MPFVWKSPLVSAELLLVGTEVAIATAVAEEVIETVVAVTSIVEDAMTAGPVMIAVDGTAAEIVVVVTTGILVATVATSAVTVTLAETMAGIEMVVVTVAEEETETTAAGTLLSNL